MYGWRIPPPKEPSKSKEDFTRERQEKVAWLIEEGLLKSERIKQALLNSTLSHYQPAWRFTQVAVSHRRN